MVVRCYECSVVAGYGSEPYSFCSDEGCDKYHESV